MRITEVKIFGYRGIFGRTVAKNDEAIFDHTKMMKLFLTTSEYAQIFFVCDIYIFGYHV